MGTHFIGMKMTTLGNFYGVDHLCRSFVQKKRNLSVDDYVNHNNVDLYFQGKELCMALLLGY